MSQASRKRRDLSDRMRGLSAGSDPSRSDRVLQRAERPLMRSDTTPRCPLHGPDLACALICRSHPAHLTPIIEFSASIKSP